MNHEYLRNSVSPINTSKSKQLYTFSKSVRFAPTPTPLSRTTYY